MKLTILDRMGWAVGSVLGVLLLWVFVTDWPVRAQAPAQAQTAQRVEFKGDWLGVPLGEFKARHRSADGPHCSDEYPQASKVLLADETDTRLGLVNCRAIFLGAEFIPRNGRVQAFTVANAPTTMHLFQFVDGRLYQIILSLKHDGFEGVRVGLIEKYGEPGQIKTVVPQNLYGAKFPSEEAGWIIGDSAIALTEYGANLETWLVYGNRELSELAKARKPKAKPDL